MYPPDYEQEEEEKQLNELSETEGEMWLKEREAKDEASKSCVTKFLIIVALVGIAFVFCLAANDAPSPMDSYPFQSITFYLLSGG